MSINPTLPYNMAAGCKDGYVYLFDQRVLGTGVGSRSVRDGDATTDGGEMRGMFCR